MKSVESVERCGLQEGELSHHPNAHLWLQDQQERRQQQQELNLQRQRPGVGKEAAQGVVVCERQGPEKGIHRVAFASGAKLAHLIVLPPKDP